MEFLNDIDFLTTFSRMEDFEACSLYIDYVEANPREEKVHKENRKELSIDQDSIVDNNNNNNNNDDFTVDLMSNQEPATSSDKQLTIASKAEEDTLVILRPDSPTQARDFKLFCEICTRSFTSKKRLENHVVNCIKRTRNRNLFSCKKCCKFFKKRTGLLKHSIKYHEERAIVVETKNREDSQAKGSIFHDATMLAVSDTLMV